MSRKQISEEEKIKYRKGCLTGLCIAIAIIVLSSGIGQVTSYRTNVKKSAKFLYEYKCAYPQEAIDNNVIIHVANNTFITVKTNLPNTGEGIAKSLILKDHIISILDHRAEGMVIIGADNKTLFDSTTRAGD